MAAKAGIWLRVSTGRQEEANQLPDCIRWCESHGYEIIRQFPLKGQSAFKSKYDDDGRVIRPKRLQEALDDVFAAMDRGEIEVLVVWALDRIERSGMDFALNLIREVKSHGGRIEFVKDGHLNQQSEWSDVTLAMSATMARNESRRKSDRMLIDLDAAYKKGSVKGRPPWGYVIVDAVNDDGKAIKTFAKDPDLILDDGRHVIEEIAARYLKGESLSAILRWLKAEGIKPPDYREGEWKNHRILPKLLANPVLMGERHTLRGIVRVEPILDRDTFELVNARLHDRAKRRPARRNAMLLSGVAVCCICGQPMISMRQPKNDRTYEYYRCTNKSSAINPCTGSRLVPMQWADDLTELCLTEGVAKWAEMSRIEIVPGTDYRAEIAAVDEKIDKLDKDADDYEEQWLALRAERKRLKSLPTVPRGIADHPTGKTIAAAWSELESTQDKNAFLRSGNVRVELGKDVFRFTCETSSEPLPPGGWRVTADAMQAMEELAERLATEGES